MICVRNQFLKTVTDFWPSEGWNLSRPNSEVKIIFTLFIFTSRSCCCSCCCWCCCSRCACRCSCCLFFFLYSSKHGWRRCWTLNCFGICNSVGIPFTISTRTETNNFSSEVWSITTRTCKSANTIATFKWNIIGNIVVITWWWAS